MTEPRRITLSRDKGWKMPDNTVKVDRSTGFGNPFPVAQAKSKHHGSKWVIGTWTGPAMWFQDTKDAAVNLSVAAFRSWAMAPEQEGLRARAMAELRGKNLACRCKDGPCHADVLMEIANA